MTRYDLLNKRVHESLSDYIGFDINILLSQGDPLIFGGAVRDSICGDPINDLDLIVGSETFVKIDKFLTKRNFKQDTITELEELYYGIRLIFVPVSFKKDEITIQLIRPRLNLPFEKELKEIFKKEYFKFAGEVDLSCCGVAYDINNKVIETYEGAIADCVGKLFKVLQDNKMHQPKRIDERIKKHTDRGWVEYAYR